MTHAVKASEIPWVSEAAGRFSDWLLHDGFGTWTKENLTLPGIWRWTVSFICYEGLFTELWTQSWFQDGTRAFGLKALEHEGEIEILKSEAGEHFIKCPDGTTIEMAAFLDGESLSIRHDPEFADLSWDPVSSMGHVLAGYHPDY